MRNQTLPKYAGPLIRRAIDMSGINRMKSTDMKSYVIYRDYCGAMMAKDQPVDINGFIALCNKRIGKENILKGGAKVFELIQKHAEALKQVTLEQTQQEVNALFYEKSFIGQAIQQRVLKQLACIYDIKLKLPSDRDEKQNIDGWLDGLPVSVKPHSHKRSDAALRGALPTIVIEYYQVKADDNDGEILRCDALKLSELRAIMNQLGVAVGNPKAARKTDMLAQIKRSVMQDTGIPDRVGHQVVAALFRLKDNMKLKRKDDREWFVTCFSMDAKYQPTPSQEERHWRASSKPSVRKSRRLLKYQLTATSNYSKPAAAIRKSRRLKKKKRSKPSAGQATRKSQRLRNHS